VRAWLLTNTTYGTWLPGSPRGSVTSVFDHRLSDAVSYVRFEHDLPGEPYEGALPGLERTAGEHMTGSPIFFTVGHAERVLDQFRETATHRGWDLVAVSIMDNHFHLVVLVLGDPAPRKVLADLKSYGSRKLNGHFGKPPSDTWWTTNGSKRKLKDERAVEDAVNYVLYKQPNPLVVWSKFLGRLV
jgi:REP element-mobilizing transposase RayT